MSLHVWERARGGQGGGEGERGLGGKGGEGGVARGGGKGKTNETERESFAS